MPDIKNNINKPVINLRFKFGKGAEADKSPINIIIVYRYIVYS